LSPDDHIRLLDHKKVAVNDRGMEVEEEATASLLIHTITLHFLGNPPSPTSSGIGTTINVLTKSSFSIDWQKLKNDYYSQTNTLLRKWFENIDHTLREQIKNKWITDMERLHVNIPFFLWFPTFTSKHGLPNVYSQPNLIKKWVISMKPLESQTLKLLLNLTNV